MVTSSAARLQGPGLGDVILQNWRQAGLLRPSVVRTGRLLVLETRLLAAQLGTLGPADLAAVDEGLREEFGLQ